MMLTLWDLGPAVTIWGRYKPVIDDIRRRELGPKVTMLENFEYNSLGRCGRLVRLADIPSLGY